MGLKDFWKLLYMNIADVSFQNETIDVVLKDCFVSKNTTVCFGNLILSVMCLITLFVCIVRIVEFFYSYRTGYLHYVIFFSAAFETLCLFLKWFALIRFYELEFVASIWKMVQFVALCHLNWSLVLSNNLVRSLITPLLRIFGSICTVIIVLAIALNFSSWIECLIPHWLILSLAELLCIQAYAVAGYYVTKQINNMNNDDIYKRQQKTHLWSVIAAYEVSAITTVIYYATLQFLGNEITGCSGIFFHVQEIFSSIYTSFMIIRYLLPIWVSISIFKESRGYLSKEESFGRFLDSQEQLINSGQGCPTQRYDIESMPPKRFKQWIPIQRRHSFSVFCSIFEFCNFQRLSSSAPETTDFNSTQTTIQTCNLQPNTSSKHYKDFSTAFSVNQNPEEIHTYNGNENC